MEYYLPPNAPIGRLEPGHERSLTSQVADIWTYLRMQQLKMNRNLQQAMPAQQCTSIAQMIQASSKPGFDKMPYCAGNVPYRVVRDNLYKTAECIAENCTSFTYKLCGTKQFKDNFGGLLSKTTLQIDGKPVGIRQLYGWSEEMKSTFGNYKANSEQYIYTGLIDHQENGLPIYGVEVGVITGELKVIDDDGVEQTIYVANPIKTRITPEEWSLWRNNTKICYTNENAIFFPQAHISGGSIAIGDNFSVTNSGILTATNGIFNGSVTATDGKIGGWNIEPNRLYSGSANGYSGMTKLGGGDASGSYAFWAGATDLNNIGGTAKFYVGHLGNFCAKDADITGNINATSGTFDNCTIHDTCSINKINATQGTIGAFNITNSYIDSRNGQKRFFLASASDSSSSWMAATDSSGTQTFNLSKDGILSAKGASFSGTVRAGTVIEVNDEGDSATTKLGELDVYNHQAITRVGRKITNSKLSHIDIGNDFVSMASLDYNMAKVTVRNNGCGFLSGTWAYDTGGVGSLSDANKKNTICDLSDKYSVLFDNLKPKTYKYNDGTSNRTHIGFIAQEVEDAIIKSGLTTQDAALVTDIDDFDDCGVATGTKTKFLRYDEIIGLLTCELQNIKKQLFELQETINSTT